MEITGREIKARDSGTNPLLSRDSFLLELLGLAAHSEL